MTRKTADEIEAIQEQISASIDHTRALIDATVRNDHVEYFRLLSNPPPGWASGQYPAAIEGKP